MNNVDAIVIGAGQSGLAATHALNARGITPLVLEAGANPVGSWPHYYDSLTLFSPARYSALPGMSFPGDPDHYPHRDEVVDYLRTYAAHLDADLRTGHRVTTVTRSDTFTVRTDQETFTAPIVIAATGGFGRPHRPDLPGLETFTGTVLHVTDYRDPAVFAGQRVIVVGAGNSAVQVATELAAHAEVSLASRTPVSFVPQRPLGRDVHFWFTVTGLDIAPIGRWLPNHVTAPVLDTGIYRAALTAGRPDRRPMFTTLEDDKVTWPDGQVEKIDAIILATGYRPDLPYLRDLGTLASDGTPLHSGGISRTHRGLGYVGLEWQRSLASASLRGVGRDARHVVARLLG
ncbi:putative flavoprotein involved in K+ transport [Amycolatopsis xylanica]|uniref:Putative flavoprotein involved in K+ transport n=1 Tax=Amycolatopsis xylanica TaxID=589385 RepID=A0A1H3S2E7_9PSEU|nr:NAD(P)-binding domain-containing protein [Amycolatopsis xylanica]SDZ32166.1 putative flavoprotein involved in K+ transport [Amycolatopsis xylanica]